MSFHELGLSDGVVHAVQSMRYVDPTPIQEQAIPLVLAGHDVIGSAQTGTGKTAAFVLPILSKLERHGKLRALILEPTRELAYQVEEDVLDYQRFTDLECAVIYGGVGYGKQKEQIEQGVDTLIATPGRLLDLMEQRIVRLDTIDFLVLDEADRMLDMGFLPDVRRIISKCPKERQTLLFSATLEPEIKKLAEWALKDPQYVEIGIRRSAAETVSHFLYPVAEVQRFELLTAILSQIEYSSVLIFTRTKMDADRVCSWLENHDHSVVAMHSDRSQVERQAALKGFRDGTYEVMVATDIASRGIDISGVTHVINYNVPENAEDYVHRIGRTGRAQTEGDALTIMSAEEADKVMSIERFIGKPIQRRKLDDFKYKYSTILDEETQAVASRVKNIRGGAHRSGHSFGHRRRKRR